MYIYLYIFIYMYIYIYILYIYIYIYLYIFLYFKNYIYLFNYFYNYVFIYSFFIYIYIYLYLFLVDTNYSLHIIHPWFNLTTNTHEFVPIQGIPFRGMLQRRKGKFFDVLEVDLFFDFGVEKCSKISLTYVCIYSKIHRIRIRYSK